MDALDKVMVCIRVPFPTVVHYKISIQHSGQQFLVYLVTATGSDVVKTLMVETETKTETWKKFESKTRDQDLKKFSRSRLGEFVRDRDETSRLEILEAKLIRIDY